MSLTVMTVEVSAIHLLIQEAFIEHLLHARSSARCRTPFKELTVSMRHSSAPDKRVLCSGSLQVLHTPQSKQSMRCIYPESPRPPLPSLLDHSLGS